MKDFKFSKKLDIRLYRKLIIVRLSEKGLTQEDIADITGCTQGLVSQVLQAWEDEGYEGLKSRPQSGRPAGLSKQDLETLKAHLAKKARAFGFKDDL